MSTYAYIFVLADNILFSIKRVSARHLEWLKEVKKAHRYTETNSLSQVQTINSRGIFKVGNIGKHSQTLAMGQEDQVRYRSSTTFVKNSHSG